MLYAISYTKGDFIYFTRSHMLYAILYAKSDYIRETYFIMRKVISDATINITCKKEFKMQKTTLNAESFLVSYKKSVFNREKKFHTFSQTSIL